MRKELKILEDHAESAANFTRAVSGRITALGPELAIAHANRSAVEVAQAINAAKERGLAAAAGTEQGYRLAGLNLQTDVVENRAIAESFGEVRDFHIHCDYRPFPQRRSNERDNWARGTDMSK